MGCNHGHQASLGRRYVRLSLLAWVRLKDNQSCGNGYGREGAATRRGQSIPTVCGHVKTAFPITPVKHVISQCIRAEINNNLSERLQGTFRDRDKTLRGLKRRESGQSYVDGLVLSYNYFRPHAALKGQRAAEKAGTEISFRSWRDVVSMV